MPNETKEPEANIENPNQGKEEMIQTGLRGGLMSLGALMIRLGATLLNKKENE